MELKQLRKEKNLTQRQCAEYLGIPLRTYIRYENGGDRNIKYVYMVEKLAKFGFIDETHGVLSVEEIKRICERVFSDYQIEFCYLFGSYAQNSCVEFSVVDVVVCRSVSGLMF